MVESSSDSGLLLFLVFGVPILGVFAVAIAEEIIRKRFPHSYFRVGIPVAKRRLTLLDKRQDLDLLSAFTSEPVMGVPHIRVQQLAEQEYGLWAGKAKSRVWFQSGNGPYLRGYLKVEGDPQVIRLILYINWTPIYFVAMSLVLSLVITLVTIVGLVFAVSAPILLYWGCRIEVGRYLEVWYDAWEAITGMMPE